MTHYTVEALMLDESFVDFVLNEASDKKEYWNEIIDTHGEQQFVFEEAKKLILMLSGKLSKEEIFAEMAKVRERVRGQKEGNIRAALVTSQIGKMYINRAGVLRQKNLKRMVAYAALVIVVTAGLLVFFLPSERSVGIPRKIEYAVTYQSGMGVRRSVKLQDGSEIILNSNSTIRIPEDYNKTDRTILLEGEAFFRVAPNKSKPFIVNSKGFSTTAVGTAFYVYGSNHEQSFKVSLLEGKVKLAKINDGNNSSGPLLLAGNEAEWNSTSFKIKKFDTLSLNKWLGGKISFKKTPVVEALKQLEAWYGVEFDIRRKDFHQKTISGDYDHVPLENILQVICFSISCKYSYINEKVVLE